VGSNFHCDRARVTARSNTRTGFAARISTALTLPSAATRRRALTVPDVTPAMTASRGNSGVTRASTFGAAGGGAAVTAGEAVGAALASVGATDDGGDCCALALTAEVEGTDAAAARVASGPAGMVTGAGAGGSARGAGAAACTFTGAAGTAG